MLGVSDSLRCAPGDMFQSTLLEKAGAVNAAAEMTGGSWVEISYEQLLTMNPQVLVIPAECYFHHQITDLSGMTIRANFYKCGDKLQQPHFLSWNPISTPRPNFHVPQFFGTLELEK